MNPFKSRGKSGAGRGRKNQKGKGRKLKYEDDPAFKCSYKKKVPEIQSKFVRQMGKLFPLSILYEEIYRNSINYILKV